MRIEGRGYDARKRQLERAAAAGGGEVEGTRVLKERLRSGEISNGQMLLAAYLGDESALSILKDVRSLNEMEINTVRSLKEWGKGIEDSESFSEQELRQVRVRAMLAALIKVLPVYEKEKPTSGWLRLFIEHIESFISDDPQDVDLVNRVLRKDYYLGAGAMDAHEGMRIISEISIAASTVIQANKPTGREKNILSGGFSSVGRAVKTSELKEIQSAVRSELMPWALGEGDPVKERVEAKALLTKELRSTMNQLQKAGYLENRREEIIATISGHSQSGEKLSPHAFRTMLKQQLQQFIKYLIEEKAQMVEVKGEAIQKLVDDLTLIQLEPNVFVERLKKIF